ncbi:hypothetical protein [Polyangium sp. 6x1]|nr:hypothetical protein [Polyangium sp. 6x1]MDI1445771.1 hypothetical protein [Polyangium sp. 6x1]
MLDVRLVLVGLVLDVRLVLVGLGNRGGARRASSVEISPEVSRP